MLTFSELIKPTIVCDMMAKATNSLNKWAFGHAVDSQCFVLRFGNNRCNESLVKSGIYAIANHGFCNAFLIYIFTMFRIQRIQIIYFSHGCV